MTISDSFRAAAPHLDWPTLERSGDSVYLLTPDLELAGWNEAYSAFALANGGDDVERRFPVGRSVLAAIDGPLREHYARVFAAALDTGRVRHGHCECSTPDEQRILRSSIYPVRGGAGLVVSHHLVLQTAHPEAGTALRPHHRRADGLIVQCGNCRKVQDLRSPSKWDWVPEVVDRPPPDISHSICPNCLDHHYPDLEPEDPGA